MLIGKRASPGDLLSAADALRRRGGNRAGELSGRYPDGQIFVIQSKVILAYYLTFVNGNLEWMPILRHSELGPLFREYALCGKGMSGACVSGRAGKVKG